jgi:predicted DNA-binding transcriptional regulator AlpA
MNSSPKRLFRLPEILEITSMKKSFFYIQIRRGLMSKPIKIGRSAYWEREAVEKFIAERIAARDAAQKFPEESVTGSEAEKTQESD